MKFVLVLFSLICFVNCRNIKKVNDSESDVGFPEHDRLDIDRTSTRVPLYIPGKCPDNQLLYPGDQKTDWICDCGPGFIYYPSENTCFGAFRKGPCEDHHILVLQKGQFKPECIYNQCEGDLVLYQKKCYELNKPGLPCKPVVEGGGIFGVNATTLELECLKGTDRLSLFNFPTRCPPGSQRDTTNNCRKTHKIDE